MIYTASLDSRLVLPCLGEAGLASGETVPVYDLLAAMLSGLRASPSAAECEFHDASGVFRAAITLEMQWDSIKVSIESQPSASIAAALEKFSRTFDAAIQEQLRTTTLRALGELDARLMSANANLDALRNGSVGINAPIARILADFHATTVDRVVQEELAGIMALPVLEKSARVTLGKILLAQFPLPAKRTHRFFLCQALTNLAEPELCDGLAALARDKQYASLRGRLCEALAKSRHPEAAKHIAAVLEDGDDETKVWAIEALGQLKASQYAELIRAHLNYESSDKDWTRAIKKAAEKTLKKLGTGA